MTKYRIYYSKCKKDVYNECDAVEKEITRVEIISGRLKMQKRVREICEEINKGLNARKYRTIDAYDSDRSNYNGERERKLTVSAFTKDTFYHWYLTVTEKG